jgi:hypothetical protein
MLVRADDEVSELTEKEQTLVIASNHTTPIPVLQSIGISLCGVPPEDLYPKKLLAKLQEDGAEEKS